MIDDKYKLTQESLDESVSEKMTTPNNTFPHCGAEKAMAVSGFTYTKQWVCRSYVSDTYDILKDEHKKDVFHQSKPCIHAAQLRKQLALKEVTEEGLKAEVANWRRGHEELSKQLADEKAKGEAVEKQIRELAIKFRIEPEKAIEQALFFIETLRTRAEQAETRATAAEALLTEAKGVLETISTNAFDQRRINTLLTKIKEGRK